MAYIRAGSSRTDSALRGHFRDGVGKLFVVVLIGNLHIPVEVVYCDVYWAAVSRDQEEGGEEAAPSKEGAPSEEGAGCN